MSLSHLPVPSSGAVDQLLTSLREHQVVMDNAGVGIALIVRRKMVRTNQRFAEIFGFSTPAEVIGRSSMSLYTSAESFHELGAAAYPVMTKGGRYQTELQMRRADGEFFWTHLTGKLIDPHNPQEGSIWIIDDISGRKAAQSQLENVLAEQNLILENCMVGIVFLHERVVTRCNSAFEKLFGYESHELHGSSSRQWYLTDEDWLEGGRRCYAPLSQGRIFEGEMLLRKKDGSAVYFDVRAKAIDPGDLGKGSIWITMDITARKIAEHELNLARENLERLVESRTLELQFAVAKLEKTVQEEKAAQVQISKLAHFDILTNLPNRALLKDRFDQSHLRAIRGQSSMALMFLDLDRFKNINDVLGHSSGDEILVQLAGRLRSLVRDQDTVARLGGDEFILLLLDTDAQGAAFVAEKLLTEAQRPFQLEHNELTITPSIGIAIYPDDGCDLESLSRKADAAMYHAKDNGRNGFQFFTGDLQAKSDRHLTLSNALRRALAKQEFVLYYQPQFDIKSNEMVGVEALLRWTHPTLGAISPAEFIPVAESNGLIVPIGEWVIQESLETLSHWFGQGMPRVRMAVNLSAVQFRQEDLPERIALILKRVCIDPDRLELELTEGVAMANPQHGVLLLDRLREQGICMAVDDFGTGYSSLSYLKKFRVHKLKIDQSFVRDITVDPEDKAIVGAIISMARSLGILTIAEGVETQEQLNSLVALGCDQVQGYFYCKPLPAGDFFSFALAHGQRQIHALTAN
jgi:diguanylate cyclase (GGDEF)-like protein/PAS domain S-box-containing protein